jgi:hypothetical protein
MSSSHGTRLLAGLLVALACALAAGPASAATKRISPARVSGDRAVFHLRGVDPTSISSARLEVRGQRVAVTLKRARDAAARGRLKVRVRRARHARLVLVLAAAAAVPGPTSGPEGTASGAVLNPACLPAFGTFKAAVSPPPCWRPYSPSSPFNRRLPASPRLSPRSAEYVRRVTGFGPVQHLEAGKSDGAGSHTTYYSVPTDPEYTIDCTQTWGRCPIEGMKVRIPLGARPAANTDAHMTVVDQVSGWEYDFWQTTVPSLTSRTLKISWGGRTRIDGDGLGSDGTASRFGNLAGVIRAEEMEAGRINHALFMVVHCDSGGYVYPAQKAGMACSSRAGAPPMGSHFMLDMSDAEIAALQAPRWKKTVLTAMAHYGMFVGDTGGTWAVTTESGIGYASVGQRDKWLAFGQANGWARYREDIWVGHLRDGIDWERRLRVVDPCVSRGTC